MLCFQSQVKCNELRLQDCNYNTLESKIALAAAIRAQSYTWLFDMKRLLYIRGAFGKFLAWSFISVTDLQTLSCLVSF